MFARQRCAVLRVSFLPNFYSRAGYQKKAIFLEPVGKTCQKGKWNEGSGMDQR